jgi:hypothetical protein
MSSVRVAATAEMELAMWCVPGGSAIVRDETASVSRERAVVDVDSSLGSDGIYLLMWYVHPFLSLTSAMAEFL